MNEFYDMLAAGSAEFELAARPPSGPITIIANAVTKNCTLSNPTLTREQQETGMRLNYDTLAELTREDATALGLYPMASGAHPACVAGGRNFYRLDIEDDPHDPMVRLHLKAAKT